MNGDVEGEAPRPRPLSAGIWTLFSWLRRTDRSSSSESVSSAGSDRTAASFDFYPPLNYKHDNTPFVLPQGPFTDSYKKRLHERNLRRLHDRDLTLRRKYGLVSEEGLGYDAFSLPTTRRLQKDSFIRRDRDRRATSECIQRRSAYVPGKRRAPLPPTVVVSATLPRNYKRKRPAPKPPVNLSDENKENVENNKTLQMNSTSGVNKASCPSKDITSATEIQKQTKHETKEIKLRTDKSFLKHIFDNKKRNSGIDISRIKVLPSISELDKQAAEIIEANKALRSSRHNDKNLIDKGSKSTSTEENWICTTCLRKYKPVVTCCIYCIIKENSNNNKNHKIISANASTMCTQTGEKAILTSGQTGIDDKKKLREMLKEMKDSLPKKTKHPEVKDIIKTTETPTLRIGSTLDGNLKDSFSKIKTLEKSLDQENLKHVTKEKFLMSQPSSSKEFHIKLDTGNQSHLNRNPTFEPASSSFIKSGNLLQNVPISKLLDQSVKESPDRSKNHFTSNNIKTCSTSEIKQNKDLFTDDVKVSNATKPYDLRNINRIVPSRPKCDKETQNLELNVNNIQPKINMVGSLPYKEKSTIDKLSPLNMSLGNNCAKQVNVAENCENVSRMLTSNKIQASAMPIKKCDSSVHGSKITVETSNQTEAIANKKNNIDLHTPLKISSLLNPLYCPKYSTSKDKHSNSNTTVSNPQSNEKVDTSLHRATILPNIAESKSIVVNVQTPNTSNTKLLHVDVKKSDACISEASKIKILKNDSAIVEDDLKRKDDANAAQLTSWVKFLNHHDRRRSLILQLEQAISKGDEKLAAEAAAELAKQKLACSVLSFSSQIVAEPMPNKTEVSQDNTNVDIKNKHTTQNTEPNAKSRTLTDEGLDYKNQGEELKPSRCHKETNILPIPTASSSRQILNDDIVTIEVWVEDKEAARGPIPLRISKKATIGELKQHVDLSLGLEIRLQRWIVGRTLCTDDNTRLVTLAGHDLSAPFYLCIVESDANKDNPVHAKVEQHDTNKRTNDAPLDVYSELVKLEQQALVHNTEEFECGVCMEPCAAGAGAVLRDCVHAFCTQCLADAIRHCAEPVAACPAAQCGGALQEREIRAILPAAEYERWLARGLAAAESGTRNTFHCRTRDCGGWAVCEPGVRRFPCPVCKHTNCVPCQAVHKGETCEQYQTKLRQAVSAVESNQADEGTQALLKSLISRGEALECPECSAIITKKWGCDWVKCSACKTEICWVTKGRRWGPAGKGDTSGGCRCGVDGTRCHPSCGYCH